MKLAMGTALGVAEATGRRGTGYAATDFARVEGQSP